ncbi:beta strand repeat-containing protein, partial [Vogesella sp. GCM10023246]
DAANNAVDENSSVGTVVGLTAFASDADATTNAVSYSLTDSAGGRFAIDASTGLVTVAGAIDRETADHYDITVRATSADGSSANKTFTIAINDVNEFTVSTPADSDAADNAVNENSAVGTAVGLTAFASDADATTNAVSYSLTDSAGGRFAINSSTGLVTVAGTLDRETADHYDITVRATSADGSSADKTFTIAINDVNEFAVSTPADTDAADNAVNENSAVGTAVGLTAFASDGDATTNAVSYSLTDSAGGRFAIDASTGLVTVAGALDRETADHYDITVRATSADGSSTDKTFTIAIGNVNDNPVVGPSDSNGAANLVLENAAIGTTVGLTAFASDADAGGQAITYSLSDNAGGRFAINSSTGVVTVTGALDYEAASSHNITVLATSADGSSNSQTFTIAVGNVNDNPVVGPSDSNGAANLVLENAAIGTTVGLTAFASDADAGGQAITYSLSDNAGGRFAINSSTGVVTVTGALDYEAASSHNITVLATSADGSSNSQTFTIAVGNVNDNPVVGPSDSNGAANLVLENAAIGTTVGLTAFASDADAGGQAITYSLSDNAGGRFTINSSTGVVTVAGALDYETATSHNITVLATSADGSSNSQSFTINVGDVDDAVPSVASITGTSSRSGNTGTATFTVTFSEAVTGVTTDDFTLFGSAMTASPLPTITGVSGSGTTYTVTVSYDGRSPSNGDRGNSLGLNLKSGTDVHDTSNNTASGSSFATAQVTSLAPAGSAGEPIQLALDAPADSSGDVLITLKGVPEGWQINGATRNADGSWSVLTAHPELLSVTTPSDFAGAMLLEVAMQWQRADGSTGNAMIYNNLEAYAPGSPIFALSSDDNLTGSSAADTFVFAQPMGNNVIYSFDATNDKIDLIGFAGVSSVTDLQIGSDGTGNAVISIGTGQSITIRGVDAANLSAANFLFNQVPEIHNAGVMAIADGAILPLGGVMDNSGRIELGAAAGDARLEVLVESLTLQGGGQVVLSDDAHNIVFGGAANATLINMDNTISGAGQLGGGQMTLVNHASIIADGSNALLLDTGSNSIVNSGQLQASGSGGMVVASSLENSGNLWANDSSLQLQQEVSGQGSALISGAGSIDFAAAADSDVSFADGGNGSLLLGDAANFSGRIIGLESGDHLDLTGLAYQDGLRLDYVGNASGTGGLLTISNGSDSSSLMLIGHYQAGDFQLGSDAAGHTVVNTSQADSGTVIGTAGNDTLSGGDGNDILLGGAGHNTLSGGAGSDTFLLLRSDGNALDSITDFDSSDGGDQLHVGDLLTGYQPNAANQFLSLREENGNTVISIDRDGAGNQYQMQDMVILQGSTGIDMTTLLKHVDTNPL